MLESLFYDLFAFILAFVMGCAVALFGFSTLDYVEQQKLGKKTGAVIYFIFFVIPFVMGLQIIFDPVPAHGFFVGLAFMLYRRYRREDSA
jgi:asparagine N-glycosylation enzyme membrane subunit Stt3